MGFAHMLPSICLSLFLQLILLASVPLRIWKWFISRLGPRLNPELQAIIPETNFISPHQPCLPLADNLILSFRFQGKIQVEELRERVEVKCLQASLPSNPTLPLYSQLQEEIQLWGGYPFWAKDQSFQLSNHVLLWAGRVESEEDCFALEGRLIKIPFQMGKGSGSPWRLYLLEGSDLTRLVFSFHHVLGDGGSLYTMFLNAVSETSELKVECPFSKFPLSGWRDAIWNNPLLFPCKVMKVFMKCKEPPPFHVPQEEAGDDRIFFKSGKLSKSQIKLIAERNGVPFTAVLTSALAGGLMKTMQGLSLNFPEWLGCPIPIPLKSGTPRLRNSLLSIYVPLPMGVERWGERLKLCGDGLREGFHSGFPLLVRLSLFFMNSLPLSWRPKPVTQFPIVLTTFPGPRAPIYYDAKANLLSDMHFICNATKQTTLIFTTLTYTDSMRIILSADPKAFPTKQNFVELIGMIEREIQIMAEASTAPDIVPLEIISNQQLF